MSVADCKKKFRQFILRYIDPSAEEDEVGEGMNLNEPLYLQKLEEVVNYATKSSFFLLYLFSRFTR